MKLCFLLLSVVVLFYIYYVFIVRKEYKKISFIYSFSLITIFFTPSIYFFLGGQTYRFFTDYSLNEFYCFSSIIFVVYLFIYLSFDTITFKRKILIIQGNIFIMFYFLSFLAIVVIYYIIYFKQFPLVYFLLYGELIQRPDTTGAIPHFYTISTIVSVIIPSFYFFYFHKFKKYQHILINIFLFFLFVASGNKGFIAYYLIFVWIYIFKAKIDFKLVFIILFLLFIYMLTKGITTLNKEVFIYMLDSPTRRFFVTQGTGFIHRIDMLNAGFDFINNANPRGLKFDVFQHMYNTNMIGSAPTFFIGNIFVRVSPFAAIALFLFMSAIVLLVSKFLNKILTTINVKLFIYWNIYSVLFFICMAGIDDISNFLRFLVGPLNIFAVFFLSTLKIKETICRTN